MYVKALVTAASQAIFLVRPKCINTGVRRMAQKRSNEFVNLLIPARDAPCEGWRQRLNGIPIFVNVGGPARI